MLVGIPNAWERILRAKTVCNCRPYLSQPLTPASSFNNQWNLQTSLMHLSMTWVLYISFSSQRLCTHYHSHAHAHICTHTHTNVHTYTYTHIHQQTPTAGSLVAFGSSDRTVRLWDSRAPRTAGEALAIKAYSAHKGWVVGASWRPGSGYHLATASHDNTIKVCVIVE